MADKHDTTEAWMNGEFTTGDMAQDLEQNARHIGRLQRNEEILDIIEKIVEGKEEWV